MNGPEYLDFFLSWGQCTLSLFFPLFPFPLWGCETLQTRGNLLTEKRESSIGLKENSLFSQKSEGKCWIRLVKKRKWIVAPKKHIENLKKYCYSQNFSFIGKNYNFLIFLQWNLTSSSVRRTFLRWPAMKSGWVAWLAAGRIRKSGGPAGTVPYPLVARIRRRTTCWPFRTWTPGTRTSTFASQRIKRDPSEHRQWSPYIVSKEI